MRRYRMHVTIETVDPPHHVRELTLDGPDPSLRAIEPPVHIGEPAEHLIESAMHLLEPVPHSAELGPQYLRGRLRHESQQGEHHGSEDPDQHPHLRFCHIYHTPIMPGFVPVSKHGGVSVLTHRRNVYNTREPDVESILWTNSYTCGDPSAHEAASNARTVQNSFSASCGVGQLESLTPTTPVARFM